MTRKEAQDLSKRIPQEVCSTMLKDAMDKVVKVSIGIALVVRNIENQKINY